MRALVYDPGQPRGLRFADVPPPDPAPSQALVEVHAVSLNFGEVGERRVEVFVVGAGFGPDIAYLASLLDLSFGKALSLELAPIRVNVLMSGVVDTAIHAGRREQMKAWAEKDLLVRRFGQPEDIAHAIEFLMTNPYMTGHTLTVDGGFVAI